MNNIIQSNGHCNGKITAVWTGVEKCPRHGKTGMIRCTHSKQLEDANVSLTQSTQKEYKKCQFSDMPVCRKNHPQGEKVHGKQQQNQISSPSIYRREKEVIDGEINEKQGGKQVCSR